jgi:hypothetical protein
MTFAEFEKKRLVIESEKFVSDQLDPFRYGLERATFRKRLNEQLLQLARLIDDSHAAQPVIQHYELQLKKNNQAIARFGGYVEKKSKSFERP